MLITARKLVARGNIALLGAHWPVVDEVRDAEIA
jgi:hypothetical protein